MSAGGLGEELLSGVKEESLDELLRALRDAQTPHLSELGIVPLDRSLKAFQAFSSSRQQAQLYTQWSTQHQPFVKEKPPAAIEITSAAACSGKLQLLYLLVTIALLPASYQDQSLGGRGQAVALLDLSGKFSILRLRDVMHGHIALKLEDTSPALSNGNLISLISESLVHLHVFRPQSTSSLITTLASMPSYLLSQPYTHYSANRMLGLVAINDLSAFLWQDRLSSDDEARLSATSGAEKVNSNLFIEHYRELVTLLRRIHDLFLCTIVATNWGLSSPTSVMGQPGLRPHLPAVWNNFCTLKVVVERDKVSRFMPGISVQEASGEKAQRWAAVEKSGFSAWVNWWGSEVWRAEVREALKGLERAGAFSFHVTKDCVVINEGRNT
ncbi:MAG: hypothetical protein Q9217_002479 [Psora testacea]